MINRMLVFFVLCGLLAGCAPAISPTPPSATPGATVRATQAPTRAPVATPSPAAPGGPPLERVAQTGGGIHGITLAGELAYVGMGPRVAAIDVSQPQSPRLIGQSEPLPGLVSQLIALSAGAVPRLLVNAGKYLLLMEAGDPESIRPMRQVELPGAITAMLWDADANVLYAGGAIYRRPSSVGYSGFVAAVGLGPGDDLKLIDTLSLPARVLSLAMAPGSLFAGAAGEEVGVYHIPLGSAGGLSAPRPAIASTPEDPLNPASLQVIGERLYLGYRSIDAYDITNPGQPVRAWRVPSSIVVKSFQASGERIIVFGWTITNQFSLDTLNAPESIHGAPVGVSASVTALYGGNLLLAYGELAIYDAVDPQISRPLGSFAAPPTHAIDAAAAEGAVFVVDNDSGATLRSLRLPDLAPLGQAPVEFPAGSGWYGYDGIAVEGERVYLIKTDGLWLYDGGGAQPVLRGKVALGDEPFAAIAAAQLGGKRLLFTARSGEDHRILLEVYDLTDLANPIPQGGAVTLDQGTGARLAWNGSILFVLLERSYFSARSDRLYALAFDGAALQLRQTLELEGYLEGLASGQRAVVLTGIDGSMRESFVLFVDAATLKIAARVTLPDIGLGVAVLDDLALVVAGGREDSAAQLLAFDLRDPAHPGPLAPMDIALSENAAVPILVSGRYVILANGSGGVEVLARQP